MPVKIVFQDASAKHERYGGSGEHVILEGDLLQPKAPSKTVLVFMHPSGIMNLLPMPMALATAGLHVLTCASRFPNNDTCLIMEKVLLDLGAVVRHAKSKLGYSKVVLCGWSGGGSLSAFYQSQAEHPTITRTPAGDEVDLVSAALPPADGLMLLAAHSSRARILTEWMDPAVLDERDHSRRDASLDVFSPGGPKAPFTADFATRYAAAQVERNRRITRWAKERLKELEASSGAEDWRRARRDEGFLVHCTMAALTRLDPALDANRREATPLDELASENHSPVGLARFTTLRAWLSQWSLDDSNADALKCLPLTSVPTFVLDNQKDDLVLPSHIDSAFEAIPHARKKLHREPEAKHYYFGQIDVLIRVVQVMYSWLAEEGLLS